MQLQALGHEQILQTQLPCLSTSHANVPAEDCTTAGANNSAADFGIQLHLVPVLRVLRNAQLLQHQPDVLALALPYAKVHALAPAPRNVSGHSPSEMLDFFSKCRKRQLHRDVCFRALTSLQIFPLLFMHANVWSCRTCAARLPASPCTCCPWTQAPQTCAESQQRALRLLAEPRAGKGLHHMKFGCKLDGTHSALSGPKSTRPDISSSLSFPTSFSWCTAGCNRELSMLEIC